MLAYHQFGNHDQTLFHSFPGSTFTSPFTYDTEFDPLAQGGAALPTSQQQHAYHPQPHAFAYSFPSLPYLPPSRPSLQLNPLSNTMEPQMMFKQENHLCQLPLQNEDASFDLLGFSPEPVSASTGTPPLSFSSTTDQYYPVSMWHHNQPAFGGLDVEESTPSADENYDLMEEDDEDIYDKPYAQLIYEALLHAPGNRMLLRDIYDWFAQNTRKPRDSGTNGWQNSIRHNLSMNQAFENDKNDPAASRGARKANSMWVLTEHAKKYGVQSTTRYRKNGAAKKAAGNRLPAVQRQRSGAKGGRAARRAARLKRQGEGMRPMHNTPSPYNQIRSPLPGTPHDEWSNYSYSPTTPAEDQFVGSSYILPHRSHCEHDQRGEAKHLSEPFLEEDEELRQMLQQANQTLNDLERS
ncbi:hypothetical protein LTR64_006576 [Lithohypha guttulata]